MSSGMHGPDQSPGPRVRWYRRLDVRLSVALVVALLIFDYFSKSVYDSALTLLGFRAGADVYFISDDDPTRDIPENEAYAFNLAQLFFAEQPTVGEASRPVDESGGVLAQLLQIQEEAFVMLDARGRVSAKSADVPWAVGSAWPFPLRSHTEVTRPDNGEVLAHAIYVPRAVGVDESPTFVLLLLDIAAGSGFVCNVTGFTQEVDSTGAPLQIFLTQTEYDAHEKRQDHIVNVVWFLAMITIAILMAAVISRRVTRRLAGMSDLAARPLPCGRLPGPFDESGGDEVARLARTMNAMRQRVNQLLDDVARQEAQRRDWLAQVSHDLRTPLTALVACLDRAELALQSPRPETLYQEVPDLLAVAKLDVDRVESLANDLFEIARLEANDALNLEPVPPGELVRQTVRGLGPLAAKKGVKLQVRLATNLPILSADGRRLMRALENLLRNAIQHAEAYVWILVDRDGDTLRFEVRDDGIGFPDQDGPLSFDDLRTRRSREDSAGLGLMVTQRVAEAHGGTAGAHNFEAGGAVVWFALPATPEAPEATDSRPPKVGLAS